MVDTSFSVLHSLVQARTSTFKVRLVLLDPLPAVTLQYMLDVMKTYFHRKLSRDEALAFFQLQGRPGYFATEFWKYLARVPGDLKGAAKLALTESAKKIASRVLEGLRTVDNVPDTTLSYQQLLWTLCECVACNFGEYRANEPMVKCLIKVGILCQYQVESVTISPATAVVKQQMDLSALSDIRLKFSKMKVRDAGAAPKASPKRAPASVEPAFPHSAYNLMAERPVFDAFVLKCAESAADSPTNDDVLKYYRLMMTGCRSQVQLGVHLDNIATRAVSRCAHGGNVSLDRVLTILGAVTNVSGLDSTHLERCIHAAVVKYLELVLSLFSKDILTLSNEALVYAAKIRLVTILCAQSIASQITHCVEFSVCKTSVASSLMSPLRC
eukprot:TRINITY_DN9488_c0_g1_i1.p1 TRINITY_DN9488_c0_g1~~TRINITY_DN9488_c0_g1_i1.p1  ORF type:complete len:384 (-),score=50.52 TRINITY_DN9488_c0_g1_i1:691-1842(-)